MSFDLQSHCVIQGDTSDLFVGMRVEDGVPKVVFPRGYRLSEDNKGCRQDALRLLTILEKLSDKRDGIQIDAGMICPTDLPLSSYLFILYDYLRNGYYSEREILHRRSYRGKIDWKRTIQKERPWINNGKLAYLNFSVQEQKINTRNNLTLIHKYCVFHVFSILGWLFTPNFMPERAQLPYSVKVCSSILREALNETNQDYKQQLFRSMLNILLKGRWNADLKNFSVGVEHFEHVWEKLVDSAFGNLDTHLLNPRTTWLIKRSGSFEVYKPESLKIDTAMLFDNKLFILDAKYYKYGINKSQSSLPGSSDISKQIIYAKYAHEQLSSINSRIPYDDVFNAFIMPYQSHDQSLAKCDCVATGDWIVYGANTPNLAYILGVCVDTRWLMQQYSRRNCNNVEALAELIQNTLNSFRGSDLLR